MTLRNDIQEFEAGFVRNADEASYALPVSNTVSEAGLWKDADKAGQIMPVSHIDRSEGHNGRAERAIGTLPSSANPDNEEGLYADANKAYDILPSSLPLSGDGLTARAIKSRACLPLPDLDRLAELQVRRKFYIKLNVKQTNALEALARRALGWQYDIEDSERESLNKRAKRIIYAALVEKDQKPEDQQVYDLIGIDITAVAAGLDATTKARHGIELEMKRIARSLPIYEWAKPIKGFGELGLAVLLAEAGNLSDYRKKGHLWKRLGLAPYNGQALSTWRRTGGLSAAEWTEAGYSPTRRAEIFSCISDPLFRQQTCTAGPYRDIYDQRRERFEERNPDSTKMHYHRDALRIMTKHLIKHTWQEWRRLHGRSVYVRVQQNTETPSQKVQ